MTAKTRTRNYPKPTFLMLLHGVTPGTPETDDNAAEYALAAGDDTDLLDMVVEPAETTDRRTAGQVRFMDDLIGRLAGLDAETGEKARAYTDRMTAAGKWTPGREGNASEWINRMMAKENDLKAAARTAGRPAAGGIEDGMYVLDGEVFKVVHAVHGSGAQYAKRFVEPAAEGERGTFEYAAGVVRRLRPEHRMTMDQATKFGQLYGVCIRCGKVLTLEESIERAMGSTCATKI
jgi:hypothetical protein